MRLNLACGQMKREGWWNVDISPSCAANEVVDLLKFPWIYADNSVDEIYASHFVEHIGEEFIPFMEECFRVLKDGGTAHFVCPYYTSIRAWQDPTHKRAISELTFSYFSQKWLKANGLSHYPIKADFDLAEIRLRCHKEFEGMEEKEFQWLREHAWNVVADIEIILKAVKSDTNEQKVGGDALKDTTAVHYIGGGVVQ